MQAITCTPSETSHPFFDTIQLHCPPTWIQRLIRIQHNKYSLKAVGQSLSSDLMQTAPGETIEIRHCSFFIDCRLLYVSCLPDQTWHLQSLVSTKATSILTCPSHPWHRLGRETAVRSCWRLVSLLVCGYPSVSSIGDHAVVDLNDGSLSRNFNPGETPHENCSIHDSRPACHSDVFFTGNIG